MYKAYASSLYPFAWVEGIDESTYREMLEEAHPGDRRVEFCFYHEMIMFCNEHFQWCHCYGDPLPAIMVEQHICFLPNVNKKIATEETGDIGLSIDTEKYLQMLNPRTVPNLPLFRFGRSYNEETQRIGMLFPRKYLY